MNEIFLHVEAPRRVEQFRSAHKPTIDEIVNEMNDCAKAEGRYLGKAFWEIHTQSESILDVPATPKPQDRIAALRAQRLQRRKKAAEQTESAGIQ